MGAKTVKARLEINVIAKDSGIDSLVKNIQNINKSTKGLVGFDKINKSLKKAQTYGAAFQKVMSNPKAVQALGKLNHAYDELAVDMKRAQGVESPNVKTIERLHKFKDAVEKAGKEYSEFTEQAIRAGDSVEKTIEIFSRGGIDVGKFEDALGKIAGSSDAIATAMPMVATAVTGVIAVAKAASAVFKKWNSQIKEFGQGLQKLWGGLKNAVGAFRLMSQGILTIARSMTFFVAAPITLFLKKATEAALGLQDALIRVAKVTGTMFDDPTDMVIYREELSKLAVVSASSMEQLAKFTEQLGQMGLREKGPMLEMVAIMDMVAAATDIAADNIAIDLGSIANAFGKSLGFSGEALEETVIFIDRAAEVINALENAAGVTASQVVKMLKDVGATFSGLSTGVTIAGKAITMNIGQIAGWATAAKEFGLSADEVGTALRNLPSYLYDNAEAIDRLHLSTDRFSNTQEFVNGLHTDFFGTVESLIAMLATDVDAMSAVSAATELLGRRSGKLLTNLVKAKQAVDDSSESYDKSGKALSRYDMIMNEAHRAWKEGGSLVEEYNKYLVSTTVKAKMLKNGFENLSMVVADDIIPSLNKLVDIASAGALAFSQLYKTLGTGTKKVMAKIIAFAALYGPVSWFLSQTVFGVAMVANGLMRLGSFITPLFGLFKTLISGLFALNPVLILIGSTLYSLFATYTGGLGKISEGVVTFFKDLNSNAGKWSKTLMDTFAGGIIEGSKAVISAIGMVAKTIASFLEAHSPPKEGPLSGIDMWGAVLMNTYLKGFAKADFGILTDVAGKIEGILGSIHFTPSGEDDEKERKNVLRGLIKFREQFTKLLKDNRKGTKITDAYLDSLLSGFGESTDEVKKLVRAHLDLEKVQQRLAAIAEERDVINERYETQVEVIRLSGQSAEDMVEAIASAAYERDNSNKALTIEERLLEKREEMMQLQLETQQELLDALQEQSDLWKELLTLQSEAGGGGDIEEGLIGAIDIDTDAINETTSKLKEAQERFIDLNVQAQKFKLVIFTIIEYVKRMWAIMFQGADVSIMEGISIDVKAKFDDKAFTKDILDSYLDIFGEIDADNTAEDFIGDYGDKIVSKLRELVPKDEAMASVREWIADTFPDISDEAKQSMEQTIADSFVEIDIGRYGEIDFVDGGEESYADIFLTDFETQAIDHANTISGLGDVVGQGFTDFFAAMASGFSGTGVDGEIPEGWGGLSDMEEPSFIQNIGETIGELARILIDNVPPILDNLGKLSMTLANIMFDLEIDEDATFLESLETILKGVATFVEDIDKLVQVFDSISNLISWVSPSGLGGKAGEGLAGWFDSIKENRTPPPPDFEPYKTGTLDFIAWAEDEAGPAIDTFFTETLPNSFGSLTDNISGFASTLATAGKSAIVSLATSFFNTLGKFINWYNENVANTLLGDTFNFPTVNISLPDTSKWQGGGSVHAGAYGTIGEAGREMFSAPVAGKITSHSLTEKMLRDVEAGSGPGGAGWIININNPTIRDDNDIDALVDTLLYKLAEVL